MIRAIKYIPPMMTEPQFYWVYMKIFHHPIFIGRIDSETYHKI